MKNTRLFMFAACTLFLAACGRQTVKIMTPPDASNRVLFGAEQLQTTLDKAGYQVMMQQGDTTFSDPEIKTILLTEVNDTTLKKEGFHISTLWDETKRLFYPHRVYVDLSQKLYDVKKSLLDQMNMTD